VTPDTVTMLERSPLPLGSARMAAQILADAFNDARRYPTLKTSLEAAEQMNTARAEAIAWLTDTQSDHLFSLAGVCRLLSLSSGRYFDPASIANLITAGVRPMARPHYRKGQA